MEVTKTDHGVSCKTVLCKLLVQTIGLHKHKNLQTSQSLQLHTFLDNKHLHNACVADVGSVNNSGYKTDDVYLNISRMWKFFPHKLN